MMNNNSIQKKDTEKIAMVGTPCQITASTLMTDYADYTGNNPMELKIGLFCMENFSYNYLKELLKEYEINLKDVVECRIEKGYMWFHLTENKTFKIPLEDVKSCIRKSCKICMDFTSEHSDISVGSVGSPEGWSTVIIRTGKGLNLVENAKKNKYIKTMPITDQGLKLMHNLALEKKSENIKEIKKRENIARPVLYWRVMPPEEYLEEVKTSQFKDLKGDVIDIGGCVLCGACLLSCPENIIQIKDRKPEISGECPPECNACYVACPRSYVPENISSRDMEKSPFGDYIKIISAKASMFHGQDGGVVTALLSYALADNLVDKVLVVDKSTVNPWKPEPKLTRNLEDVIKASGTKYAACPIFKPMKNE